MATKKRKVKKDKAKLGDIVVLKWYDACASNEWSAIPGEQIKPPLITSYGLVNHLPTKDEEWWNLVSMWDEEISTIACEQAIPTGIVIDVRVLK